MKKLLFVMVVIIHSNLFAGSYIGLNLRSVYSSGDNSSFDLKFGPILSRQISNNWEISPSIGFIRTHSTVSQDYQDYKITQYSLWAECGFYRHFIKSEIFRFSLGPNIFFTKKFKPTTEISSNNRTTEITPSNYNNYIVSLGMPINIDFVLSKRLLLRLSAKVVSADLNYSNGNGSFRFEVESFPSPSFMLFYHF